MWPKAFTQIVELAPHISRLLPMADRFFQNKSSAEDATRQTLEGLAAGLRADLAQLNTQLTTKTGQIASAQVSLSGQIEALGTQVGNMAADARAAKLAAETLDARLSRLESRQNHTGLFFAVVLLLLVAILVVQALLFTHSR